MDVRNKLKRQSLELHLIYRVGELLKGIGNALMEYATEKSELLPEKPDSTLKQVNEGKRD